MMRKKLIVCLLTGIIAVSAMACGPAADDKEKSAGQEPAIQEETADAPEPEASAPEITAPEGYHI